MGPGEFPRTRWTLIINSRESPEQQREMLAELLKAYWRPLYVYLRRKGMLPAEAEDAVQGFAVNLIERNFLARLDPGRGRLRAYLKTALSHYVANLRDHATAEKRGGANALPLDFEVAERALAATTESPEDAYQRAWAEDVFERALDRLKRDFESSQRRGPFDVIVKYFQGSQSESYAEVAAQYGMSVPQLKSFLHRARARFRELLREEIAETVAHAQEVDSELQELIKAL